MPASDYPVVTSVLIVCGPSSLWAAPFPMQWSWAASESWLSVSLWVSQQMALLHGPRLTLSSPELLLGRVFYPRKRREAKTDHNGPLAPPQTPLLILIPALPILTHRFHSALATQRQHLLQEAFLIPALGQGLTKPLTLLVNLTLF